MNETDERLRLLLKQWSEIDPPANFEANVRRRIRLAQSERAGHVALAEWLRRPAFSVAAATVIAVFVGVWSGVQSVPKPVTAARTELGFLGHGTLAGSYVTAIT